MKKYVVVVLIALLCALAGFALAEASFDAIAQLPEGIVYQMTAAEAEEVRRPHWESGDSLESEHVVLAGLEGIQCRRSYVFVEDRLWEIHVTLTPDSGAAMDADALFDALWKEMGARHDFDWGTVIYYAEGQYAVYFSIETQWELEQEAGTVRLGFYPPNDNYDAVAGVYEDGKIWGCLTMGMTREEVDEAIGAAGLGWEKETHPDYPTMVAYHGMKFTSFNAPSAMLCEFAEDGHLEMVDMSLEFSENLVLMIANDELKALMEKKCGPAIEKREVEDNQFVYYQDQELLACVFKEPGLLMVSIRYMEMPEGV